MEPDRLAKDLIALRLKAFNLVKERSFQRRAVVLSSGKKSDYYLDLKPTMLHPEGADLLCQLIYPRLIKHTAHYIGGLEMGAVPIIGPLTIFSFMKGRHIPGFFVRKEVKAHGTKRLIEGVSEGELRGKNVVILEDVTTEGRSAMRAVDAAKDAGAKVILVLSLVDREAGAAELFKKAGVPFEALFRASDFLRATEPAAE
jgi:orotate phosphoribosyltransferase